MGLPIVTQSLVLLLVNFDFILPEVEWIVVSVAFFASLLEPFPCMSRHPSLFTLGAPEVAKTLVPAEEVCGCYPLALTTFVGIEIWHTKVERHDINDKKRETILVLISTYQPIKTPHSKNQVKTSLPSILCFFLVKIHLSTHLWKDRHIFFLPLLKVNKFLDILVTRQNNLFNSPEFPQIQIQNNVVPRHLYELRSFLVDIDLTDTWVRKVVERSYSIFAPLVDEEQVLPSIGQNSVVFSFEGCDWGRQRPSEEWILASCVGYLGLTEFWECFTLVADKSMQSQNGILAADYIGQIVSVFTLFYQGGYINIASDWSLPALNGSFWRYFLQRFRVIVPHHPVLEYFLAPPSVHLPALCHIDIKLSHFLGVTHYALQTSPLPTKRTRPLINLLLPQHLKFTLQDNLPSAIAHEERLARIPLDFNHIFERCARPSLHPVLERTVEIHLAMRCGHLRRVEFAYGFCAASVAHNTT